GLFRLIGEIVHAQVSVTLAREFALDDEPSRQNFSGLRFPSAGKGAITPGVGGDEKRFHGLTQNLARNCQAQLLKAVPTQTVKVIHVGNALNSPRRLALNQPLPYSRIHCAAEPPKLYVAPSECCLSCGGSLSVRSIPRAWKP